MGKITKKREIVCLRFQDGWAGRTSETRLWHRVISPRISSLFPYSRFPYKADTVNEWFNLPPEDDWPERGEAVKVINVDKCGLARKCYRTQNEVENPFPDSLEDDEFEVFFHGTSHESAEDIIEGGIDLGKGARKRDFSDGDGFI